MSDVSLDYFEPLVVKALLDAEFRNRLMDSFASAVAAGKEQGIELDGEDLIKLKRLYESLTRFAATPGLTSDDAKNWAIGALLTAAKKDWPLNIMNWQMDLRHRK